MEETAITPKVPAELQADEAKLRNRRLNDEHFKHSLVPALLVFILTTAVVFFAVILVFLPIPVGNKDVLLIVLGGLLAVWTNSISYYIGTSKSSFDKNKALNS